MPEVWVGCMLWLTHARTAEVLMALVVLQLRIEDGEEEESGEGVSALRVGGATGAASRGAGHARSPTCRDVLCRDTTKTSL